jgi:3-hydroxyisobutyrate dehydrogenase-like beta-hydroxyacid dehydrogenase
MPLLSMSFVVGGSADHGDARPDPPPFMGTVRLPYGPRRKEHEMNVALVGLGRMGVPIAERILAAGHRLTVYNRTPGKADDLVASGAAVAGSPAGLLDDADVCITMVADDAALEAVTTSETGVLARARPGTVLVDMSTVSVAGSGRVAEAAGERGVEYLRAPVSGNPGVVRAGNLTIVVSGQHETFERVEPLLRDVGPNVYHVGEADEARVVKLALNMMIAGTAELMAEAILLGDTGGVSRATLLEVMGNSAVGSPFVKYKTAPLIEDDYSATFTTAMMRKDLVLALALAGDSGLPLPVTTELEALLGSTVEAGYGDADFMAQLLVMRDRAAAGGWKSGAAAPASAR